MRGSIRGVKVIKVPRALAALDLSISLEGSAKAFANVLCSWGKKGFKNVGIFSRRLFSVNKIAAIRSLVEALIVATSPATYL